MLTNEEFNELYRVGERAGIIRNALDLFAVMACFENDNDFINYFYVMAHTLGGYYERLYI